MPTFTLSRQQLDVLKIAVNEKLAWLQTRVQSHRHVDAEVPPMLVNEVDEHLQLQKVLGQAENIGTFDASLALKVLDRAASSAPAFFYWLPDVDHQEDVEHAIRLHQLGVLEGHWDRRHGLQATGGLTERGQVLRDLLGGWAVAPPITKPR